ncbi:hypothetical protein COW36_02895 [bacterium (Candidatus Blackallbacteria) CG17_big_fil_post_rev_8_21_14_2_50_48_46]|uniref:Glycosyltransferase 2-like domain-containing protein n=1 Tax=bacterium (Candidatus Blackallbacteria) CG17_big_fil_post_rev_8_21_14_2_50_48_46 TaxID=2014261 RepID=A0A2M7GAA4_9BACT|nr:MAG: hypothetical protein COW64_12580 [bacterium (Candidatus Blackallbacteria) CG18_big_fil_WC_8_21_14_2_50_49_26]PIW19075.1 MAG: hypothetical protein COW36_02895 [bacterium (Candidatus Blackallbacteria) CG17_big_fil_post_rev_8_21_14_2_50_48_46]PIW44558.1 MAG: hypothetical protein COW20_23225 [bacterium (Candidatus Blackallbacteria) CG13_big_fil_rev_8_21_14_2_50_49_14]
MADSSCLLVLDFSKEENLHSLWQGLEFLSPHENNLLVLVPRTEGFDYRDEFLFRAYFYKVLAECGLYQSPNQSYPLNLFLLEKEESLLVLKKIEKFQRLILCGETDLSGFGASAENLMKEKQILRIPIQKSETDSVQSLSFQALLYPSLFSEFQSRVKALLQLSLESWLENWEHWLPQLNFWLDLKIWRYGADRDDRPALENLIRKALAEPEDARWAVLLSLYNRFCELSAQTLEAYPEALKEFYHLAQKSNAKHLRILEPVQNQKIGVLIITYNRVNLLKKAVESVLAQTYQNWELYLANHGSTDETEAYCLEIVKRDSRVKYIKKEVNNIFTGYPALKDEFCDSVDAEWVTIIGDDDWINPESLEKAAQLFQKYPWISLASGGYCTVDHEDKILAQNGPHYSQDTVVDARLELQRNTVNCPIAVGFVVRKSCLRELVKFEQPFSASALGKYALWEYLTYVMLVASTEVALSRYSAGMHFINVTSSQINYDFVVNYYLGLIDKLVEEYNALFGQDSFPKKLVDAYFHSRILYSFYPQFWSFMNSTQPLPIAEIVEKNKGYWAKSIAARKKVTQYTQPHSLPLLDEKSAMGKQEGYLY